MAKETTKTSTELTVQSLEDSGIKTQITQGDLIDIVVQDKYEKIQAEVDRLNHSAEVVQKKYEDFIDLQKNNFLKELQKIDPSIVIDNISIGRKDSRNYSYDCQYITTIYFKEDTNSRTENSYIIQAEHSNQRRSIPGKEVNQIVLELKCVLEGGTEGDVAGVKGIKEVFRSTKTYIKELKVPAKVMAAFHKALEAHNEECTNMLSLFPTNRINLNKIARETKTKMNKAILKNQAPAVQEQMAKIFGVEF